MTRIVHLPVTRRARLAVVGEAGAEELWILLHGYRQLAPRFIRHFRALHAPERRLVAPEGHSRFYLEGTPGPHRQGDPVGASWMTREDREREIADYVDYLDEVVTWAGPEVARLRVLGFSQGVHTAGRWVGLGEAFRGPKLRARTRLILWGASLPGDLSDDSVARFGSLDEVTLVRGEDDDLRNADAEGREEECLRSAGVDFHVRTHAGGHRIDGALLAQLADGGDNVASEVPD